MDHYTDSTNKPVRKGSIVRHRSQEYTILDFIPKEGRFECAKVIFEESQHTGITADEISIDVVKY